MKLRLAGREASRGGEAPFVVVLAEFVSSRRLFSLVLIGLAVGLALHAWRYWPFVSEETFVSLRYAARIAQGQGFAFSEHERVEGFTNFLWILINAILAWLGIDPLAGARALGFAGVVLALACAGLDPRRGGVFVPRLVAGGVMIIATVPVVLWSIGGLEQGLVAGLVALSMRLLERAGLANDERRAWVAGLPVAAVVLLTAHGPLLALGLLGGAACLPRASAASLRRVARTAIPSAIALASQLAFRLLYYGDFLPSPARHAQANRLASGFEVLGTGLASASMLVLLAVAATVLTAYRGERARLVMPWAVVLASSIGVVLSGIDPSPGHRGLVPALVALCFVAADEVGDEWPRIARERLLILPILALCAFLHGTQSSETEDVRRARVDRTPWEGFEAGRVLREAFAASGPLLVVESPGALAFAADFELEDLTGVHGTAPRDAAAVLRRKPDLVVFGSGPGRSQPVSALGKELFASRRFRDAYQWIAVETGGDKAGEIWVRREGGRLGISRATERVQVPGYFFTGQASRAHSVLARGALTAKVPASHPGVLQELELSAGRYRVDVDAIGVRPVVDVRCRNVSLPRKTRDAELVFEVDGKTPVSILVASPSKRSSSVRRVTLSAARDSAPPLRCASHRRPLSVPLSVVQEEPGSKNFWNHPAHLAFTRAGLLLDAGRRESVKGVELSLNRYESYVVELRRDGSIVWSTAIDAKRSGRRSLETHRFVLPKPLESAGTYEIFVRPRGGEAPSVLGHALLL